MIAIQTTGLTKVIDGRMVLRNVSLKISAGECVAITGANGAGKTTLLRSLCGATRPTSGSIYWYGQTSRNVAEVRRLIGYVAHEPQLYPYLTVRENLVFAARMHGLSRPLRRADEQLQAIGLQCASDQLASRISRGMRQRLAIARAVIHDPRIVLLDEPFTGLDRQGCAWLDGLLRQLRQPGRAVCFVTHQLPLQLHLADRVWYLHGGEIQETVRGMNHLAQQVA